MTVGVGQPWQHPAAAVRFRDIAVAVGVLIAATACGSQPVIAPASTATTATTFEFKGYVAILNDSLAAVLGVGSGCEGGANFPDLARGGSVTVYDNTGAIVGVGPLGTGKVTAKACLIPFSVPNVPAGKGFYSYEVGHRGKLTLTEAEAGTGLVFSSLDAN